MLIDFMMCIIVRFSLYYQSSACKFLYCLYFIVIFEISNLRYVFELGVVWIIVKCLYTISTKNICV